MLFVAGVPTSTQDMAPCSGSNTVDRNPNSQASYDIHNEDRLFSLSSVRSARAKSLLAHTGVQTSTPDLLLNVCSCCTPLASSDVSYHGLTRADGKSVKKARKPK